MVMKMIGIPVCPADAVEEIKEIYRKGLTFEYVDDIHQVLEHALLKVKVENALEV